MQMERFFSPKLVAVVASFVIAACLTFTLSPHKTARGFSTVSASHLELKFVSL